MVNFPTSLDELTNPASDDTLDSPSHADQHANSNDILEALEAKVGVNSSAVVTSLDYKLSGITGQPSIATGAEVTTGTDNTKIVTPKAIGDAGVNTRLKSKIITATRDMTAASGDVAYTGVGFTPTAIHVIGAIADTTYFCSGFADSSKAGSVIYSKAANTFSGQDTYFILMTGGAGINQNATVKSYDADGFTLTWTKAGSPTGTASFRFLCFR